MTNRKSGGARQPGGKSVGPSDRTKTAGAVALVLLALAALVYAGKAAGIWLQPDARSLVNTEALRNTKPSPEALERFHALHPGETPAPYGVPLKPGQHRPPLHGDD